MLTSRFITEDCEPILAWLESKGFDRAEMMWAGDQEFLITRAEGELAKQVATGVSPTESIIWRLILEALKCYNIDQFQESLGGATGV